MNAVSPHVRPAVCPTGTTGVSHAGACWVQNQNQNQTVLTVVCGVSGYASHPSHGDLGERHGWMDVSRCQ